MSGPNKKATTLGQRAELMERWGLVAGLVVVGGLLVESGPELAHSVTHREWPSRGVIGNLVVALGVAGEVLFSWRAVRAARQAELQAEQHIAELNSAVAEANERAANAEKATAEANLARARLARRFKWRTLTPEAYIDLQAAPSPLAGTRLDIFAFDNHREDVMPFGYEVTNVSRRAGLDCKLWTPSTAIPRIRGVRTDVLVASAKECTPEDNEFSSVISMAFAQAFVRSGIKVNTLMHGFSVIDPIAPDAAPGTNSWNPSDVAPFRIQIVEKELLDSPF
jgi:hypothetical protein